VNLKVSAATLVAAVAATALGLFVFARKILNREKPVGEAVIKDPEEHTTTDASTGSVRSIQAADMWLPADKLEEIWTPAHLERLARTYWRFLSRSTLGIVRILYTDTERYVVAFGKPLVLLTFQAPEYEMDIDRGIVRWRIEKGILVSKAGRGGDGYLELDVQRCPSDREGYGKLHVEVEVANFYPSIASSIGRWVYANTQSRIHVIVTHGFLRSLARLDLAESKVGRYAPTRAEVAAPSTPPRQPVSA